MPEAPSSALKQRILDAAIGILEREGSRAVTVRAVAQVAGCSTIGVYTHFTDKSGLFNAIIVDGFTGFGAALNKARPRGGRAGLIASAVAYREWALANRTKYLVMFSTVLPEFTPRPDVYEATVAVFDEHVARVRSACDSGELQGAPRELAQYLWATVHGHVMLELNEGAAPTPQGSDRYLQILSWALDGIAPAAQ